MKKKIEILERQLEAKTEENDRMKVKLNETSPEVIRLRKELRELQLTNSAEVTKAEKRAEVAEARAVKVRIEQEQRVNSLETRLQELSETVGTYDRLRQHDQEEIEKLKERLQILDSEKRSLSRSLSESPKQVVSEQSDDAQKLLDVYKKVKVKLMEIKERDASVKDELDSILYNDEEVMKLKSQCQDLESEVLALKRQKINPSVSLEIKAEFKIHNYVCIL